MPSVSRSRKGMMDLKQQPIIHLVRHARYRRLGVLFDCWEPGYGQSFMLGATFMREGGRGSCITHILTSEEPRATHTAHEAFEIIERTGIEVREYAALRGDPRENARCSLRGIVRALPRHDSGRIEILVVTHRRFIDNILQRSWDAPDFQNTEFRSYVMNEYGSLTLLDRSTLPTQTQIIRRSLEKQMEPGCRWILEMRLSLERIIKKEEKITIQKIKEIQYLRTLGRPWAGTTEKCTTSNGDRYIKMLGERHSQLNLLIEAWEQALWRKTLAREMVGLLADIEVTENETTFMCEFGRCVEVVKNWNLMEQTLVIKAYISSQRLEVEGDTLTIMKTSGQEDKKYVMCEIHQVSLERCIVAPFLKGTKWEEKMSIPMKKAMKRAEVLNSWANKSSKKTAVCK